ncbi:MAG: N-acetyl-gamma-glutamyl-phosphate reductase [Bacteroidota bacterium]
MIQAAIIGGGGYTAGELIRLLIQHPLVYAFEVVSHSQAGKMLHEVHPGLIGETFLQFQPALTTKPDVLFLCMGHGKSKSWLQENIIPDHTKVIDLSRDFRLKDTNNPFVYGLPEGYKKVIKKAKYVANPGCFATAIQLALLPLAKASLIQSEVHIQAITGSTGAGQSPSDTSHFSWRSGNLSVYKAFNHQHLGEIKQTLNEQQSNPISDLHFLPLRGNFTRGIFSTLYLDLNEDLSTIQEIYQSSYAKEPFVWINTDNTDLKQVVNTNKCILHLEKHKNKLLIISMIDNLLKGASGQAIQNMNLLFGFEETTGLQLKALAF